MKRNHLTFGMISLSLLLTLKGCSDATQFTEKTFPAELDATVGSEENQTQATETSETAPPTSTTSSEQPAQEQVAQTPVVYEGSDEPDQASEEADQTSDNPAQSNGATIGTNQLFRDCEDYPERAIVAQVYPLAANTQKLPDFSTLTSTGTDVCLAQLNIADRDFNEGFPGVPDLVEWFGLDLRFKVTVPASGNYQFTLRSDDGAILYINDSKVVDNDGLHQVRDRSANIILTAGQTYDFRIAYYQGPRYRIALELFWRTPGSTTRTYIPEELLSRP